METGGSSVEAVVGVSGRRGVVAGGDVSSVSGSAVSSIVDVAVVTSRPVRSGKLNSFTDHVIHRNSNMLSISSY